MPLSRRSFVSTLGLGSAGLLAAPAFLARGREAATPDRWRPYAADARTPRPAAQGALLRLDSNENPNGPSRRALDALQGVLRDANRYPDAYEYGLMEALGREHGVPAECIVLGTGSGESLRQCVQAFTAPGAPLVTASPSFELPADLAAHLGHPVVKVPVDAKLRLDLDAMAARANGAGLVFVCNPNNPTATVHGDASIRGFIAQVRRASPGTTILVDEAYHEYVDDPSYRTAIPLTQEDPRVVVTRTFSKVFGMAGLRVGYSVVHRETARRMQPWRVSAGVNALAAAAARASVGDAAHVREEQRKNRDAKAFTRGWFERAGYAASASETNFLMIDLKRDPAPVRAACRAAGVAVGRPFPPLDTWLRVSIGTREEMERAVEVFRKVLA